MNRLTLAQVVITPEIAADMLIYNTNNRKLRPNRVSEYAEMMKRGMWEINTDCIGIDEDGVLINGQHRLEACVKSGVPFESIVASGFRRKTFEVIDQNAQRSGADIAKDDDPCIKNPTSQAVIKHFVKILSIYKGKNLNNIMKVDYTRKYIGITRIAYSYKNIGGKLANSAPTVAAAIAARMNGVKEEDIVAFLKVGLHQVGNVLDYNYNPVLEYIDHKNKSIIIGGCSAVESLYKEAKKAIYMFSNNVKRTKKEDFYDITNEMFEDFNNQMMEHYGLTKEDNTNG